MRKFKDCDQMKQMSLTKGKELWQYKLCLKAETGYQIISLQTP